MPITPFLNGQNFDPETRRILGVAFELVCVALRIGDCDDDVKQAIANKIIQLASDGQRNPDVLGERALKVIREEPSLGYARPPAECWAEQPALGSRTDEPGHYGR
jgi:hypothetical protein